MTTGAGSAKSRTVPWVRAIAAAVVAHLLTVAAILLGGVAFFALRRGAGAASFPDAVQRSAPLVGPVAGAAFVFLCAWWTARRAPGRELPAGLVVGGIASLPIVVALFLSASARERLVYAGSVALKLAAGVVAGFVTGRTGRARSPRTTA